jgi:hypothetical protein
MSDLSLGKLMAQQCRNLVRNWRRLDAKDTETKLGMLDQVE